MLQYENSQCKGPTVGTCLVESNAARKPLWLESEQGGKQRRNKVLDPCGHRKDMGIRSDSRCLAQGGFQEVGGW